MPWEQTMVMRGESELVGSNAGELSGKKKEFGSIVEILEPRKK